MMMNTHHSHRHPFQRVLATTGATESLSTSTSKKHFTRRLSGAERTSAPDGRTAPKEEAANRAGMIMWQMRYVD